MRALFVVALLALTCSCADEISDPPSRNLSSYDVIGPFSTNFAAHRDSHRAEAQVREFLWEHWRQHRNGTLVITKQYVEAVFKISYFVEADKAGNWVIAEEAYSLSSNKPQRFSCSRIERVEHDGVGSPLARIPDEEQREPERYYLHPACDPQPIPRLW